MAKPEVSSAAVRWSIATAIVFATFGVGWWLFEGLFKVRQESALVLATIIATFLHTPLTAWVKRELFSLVDLVPVSDSGETPAESVTASPAKDHRAWVYGLLVVVALGVGQIIMLFPILALILYDVPEWAVGVGSVCFVIATLGLARAAGIRIGLRRWQRTKVRRRASVWPVIALWITVGIGAGFAGRLIAFAPLRTQTDIPEVSPDVAAPTTALSVTLAAFLVLYGLAGLVTAFVSLRLDDPGSRALRVARRARVLAEARVARRRLDEKLALDIQAEERRRQRAEKELRRG